MTSLLIIKAGSAETTVPDIVADRGDFERWIACGIGMSMDETHVARIRDGEPLPEPSAYRAIVITGSAAMVTDRADWTERLREWIPVAIRARVPMLGICFGHQAIADALGGRVDWNPRGREMGTISVQITEHAKADPLFCVLPPEAPFHASHLQSVFELPPGATHLAFNDHDPNQAFRVEGHVWGVQFHPEFELDVIRGYIVSRAEALEAEGLVPSALLERTRTSAHGAKLLERFGAFVRSSTGR